MRTRLNPCAMCVSHFILITLNYMWHTMWIHAIISLPELCLLIMWFERNLSGRAARGEPLKTALTTVPALSAQHAYLGQPSRWNLIVLPTERIRPAMLFHLIFSGTHCLMGITCCCEQAVWASMPAFLVRRDTDSRILDIKSIIELEKTS